VKYEFIRSQRREYKIIRLCEVLEVSTSGYYDWLDRPESTRHRENRVLTDKIRHFHRQSNEIYGSPKVHEDLVADGETWEPRGQEPRGQVYILACMHDNITQCPDH